MSKLSQILLFSLYFILLDGLIIKTIIGWGESMRETRCKSQIEDRLVMYKYLKFKPDDTGRKGIFTNEDKHIRKFYGL